MHLSLSAGYDSRLLLAPCLDAGLPVTASVMGYPDSTDVVVAQALGGRAGLPVDVVELRDVDYLRLGREVAQATSGVKAAAHWHTYLYTVATRFASGVHLVGSNGEFARTFFFDRRRLAPLLAPLPAAAARTFWLRRLSARRASFSMKNPLFDRLGIRAAHLARHSSVAAHWRANRFLPALDAFYAEQRVRHFIGSGLACYAVRGSPRSPFLDARWMRSVARLSRQWVLGSRFHATATHRLAESIASLPYNRLPNGEFGTAYHPFARVCMGREVTDMLIESRALDTWTTRAERMSILTDRGCDQVEERSLWMTLHFACDARDAIAGPG